MIDFFLKPFLVIFGLGTGVLAVGVVLYLIEEGSRILDRWLAESAERAERALNEEPKNIKKEYENHV